MDYYSCGVAEAIYVYLIDNDYRVCPGPPYSGQQYDWLYVRQFGGNELDDVNFYFYASYVVITYYTSRFSLEYSLPDFFEQVESIVRSVIKV